VCLANRLAMGRRPDRDRCLPWCGSDVYVILVRVKVGLWDPSLPGCVVLGESQDGIVVVNFGAGGGGCGGNLPSTPRAN
jgi:hypothetical protein